MPAGTRPAGGGLRPQVTLPEPRRTLCHVPRSTRGMGESLERDPRGAGRDARSGFQGSIPRANPQIPSLAYSSLLKGKGTGAKLQGRARRQICGDALLLPRAHPAALRAPALPALHPCREPERISRDDDAAELPVSRKIPIAFPAADSAPGSGESSRGEALVTNALPSPSRVLHSEGGVFTAGGWDGSCAPLPTLK